MRPLILRAAVVAALTGLSATAAWADPAHRVKAPAAGDATVVAVIDSGMSPYHWDYLASKMPQAANDDPRDDLPLDVAPDRWLPGFPKPNAFDSYQPLELTLESRDPKASMQDLYAKDSDAWSEFEVSGAGGINYYWIPGTKVIGALSFGGSSIHGSAGSGEHGMGSASVSTGNIYGTCPECLLVFIKFTDSAGANRAVDWAMRQPWIDVITNSYGFHTVGTGVTRDNVYGGADTELQRKASERGQTIFWSAGNGYENGFVIPNQTLLSSQKGPDWIVTVTATTPNGEGSYTGAGKPADVAGVGLSYPSSWASSRVTGGAHFGGTSNATPTVAGTYARALYLARRAMSGPSRVQSRGVIAKGAFRCGAARRTCELGDGRLTAHELRTRLLLGARHRSTGHTPRGLPRQDFKADERFLVEGHGTYLARVTGKKRDWLAEFEQVRGPLFGVAAEMRRDPAERQWFVVDSWCRQRIWGAWKGGYYVSGSLPEDDAQRYPTRAAYRALCMALVRPPAVPPS